jgi:hypothetical protein
MTIGQVIQPGESVAGQREDLFTVGLLASGPPSVQGAKLKLTNIPIGSVALTSVGTNTADIIQLWVTDIFVPVNRLITTVGVLQGGTATTDNILVAIYDAKGNLLASSALAGKLLATTNIFTELALALDGKGNTLNANGLQLYGPAQYYIAVQGNGTAAGAIQTVPAPYLDICAGAVTAGTFGTLPNPITVPTTFTAAKAPIVYVY